jgi:hypothetical protein
MRRLAQAISATAYHNPPASRDLRRRASETAGPSPVMRFKKKKSDLNCTGLPEPQSAFLEFEM